VRFGVVKHREARNDVGRALKLDVPTAPAGFCEHHAQFRSRCRQGGISQDQNVPIGTAARNPLVDDHESPIGRSAARRYIASLHGDLYCLIRARDAGCAHDDDENRTKPLPLPLRQPDPGAVERAGREGERGGG